MLLLTFMKATTNNIISDLAHSLQHKVKPLLVQATVQGVILQCLRDCELYSPTYDVANWAHEVNMQMQKEGENANSLSNK